MAKSKAKKSAQPPSAPTSTKLTLLVCSLVALIAAVVAYGFLRSDQIEQSSSAAVSTNFSVEICRFRNCHSFCVTDGLLFDDVTKKASELFVSGTEMVRLVNQSGDPITNLAALSQASDEAAENRGLSPMWRGVRVLIGSEKFFWPVPRNNGSDYESTFTYFIDGHGFEVRPLYDRPRIFELLGFLKPEECNHLISRAQAFKEENKFVESSVGGDDASKVKSLQRTSTQAWIGPAQRNDDEIFSRLRTRAAKFLKLDLSVAEDTQIVHYANAQHYYGHHDYTPTYAAPTNQYFQNGGNRLATLLYYLNDVPEGGSTRFPFAQTVHPVSEARADLLYSERACTVGGLSVAPEKGKAILFYSLEEDGHMDGAVDPTSLHAACPTTDQEKWLANQWFRNKRVKVNGKWHLYDNHW